MKKVYLIGDSIRMAYDAYVKEKLSGEAEVFFPEENCRFAQYVLRYAQDWMEKDCELSEIDVSHFNAGLWDCAIQYGDCLTPPDVYELMLRRVVNRLRRLCPQAKLIFATSTPIIEARYTRYERFHRTNELIRTYNEIACRVMREMDVPVDDLYAVAETFDESLYKDATHPYMPEGRAALGDAVCAALRRALA